MKKLSIIILCLMLTCNFALATDNLNKKMPSNNYQAEFEGQIEKNKKEEIAKTNENNLKESFKLFEIERKKALAKEKKRKELMEQRKNNSAFNTWLFESALYKDKFETNLNYGLMFPLIDASYYRITSPFGERVHPVLNTSSFHLGLDIAAPYRTPVYAATDGYIEESREAGSYGNMILLRAENEILNKKNLKLYANGEETLDILTRYAHLDELVVNAGDIVDKGDLIGYVGSTGRSTGPHLHFEVIRNGEVINPIRCLNYTSFLK